MNDEEEDDEDEEGNEEGDEGSDLIPSDVICKDKLLFNEQSRIIDGTTVVPNSWKWIVHLGNCGGSILSSEWIITAKHCIKFYQEGLSTVTAGLHNRNEAGEAHATHTHSERIRNAVLSNN